MPSTKATESLVFVVKEVDPRKPTKVIDEEKEISRTSKGNTLQHSTKIKVDNH